MNLFTQYLPASSPICIAWNRYSTTRQVSASITPDVAVEMMVDAFCVGESVFMPRELKGLEANLCALVRHGALSESVAEKTTKMLRLT